MHRKEDIMSQKQFDDLMKVLNQISDQLNDVVQYLNSKD